MKKILLLIVLILFYFNNYEIKAQGFDKPQYDILTKRAGIYLGTFRIELFPLIAPLATRNFDSLVSRQFFDSTAFHRVAPGFVIQGGDPNSIHGPMSTWGQGNPNQPLVPAEFSVVRHERGRLGAARDTDTNSANSQFYICVAPATFLDGQYTVYGQVVQNMNIVDSIVNSPRDGNEIPLEKIEMFVSYVGVNDSIPDAPALISPPDLSQNLLNTQTFSWSQVSSAVMYTVEFSTDPAFSTISFLRNAGLTTTTQPLLNGSTTYYWRVKSNNGGHQSLPSNVYSFTTATAAAQLIYPADLSTGIAVDPFFEWSQVAGATDYTLQVSNSSTFTTQTMVYNQSGLSGTTQQVTGLNQNTLYYWRVRSANAGIQGYYSAKYSFVTGTRLGLNELNNTTKNIIINSIHPNPVQNKLTISGRLKQAGTLLIAIKDYSGKQVYSTYQVVNQEKFNAIIDVSKIKKGMYLVCISLGDEQLVRKIEIN